MAYSYSGDPANSTLDEYRFLIGDTGEYDSTPLDNNSTGAFLMADEEINYILDTYTACNSRLYHLYTRLANLLSRNYKRSLGPQYEDPTSRLDYYVKQAAHYRKLSTASGISLPDYNADKTFSKGMHDND